jgi:hypothetical protein
MAPGREKRESGIVKKLRQGLSQRAETLNGFLIATIIKVQPSAAMRRGTSGHIAPGSCHFPKTERSLIAVVDVLSRHSGSYEITTLRKRASPGW